MPKLKKRKFKNCLNCGNKLPNAYQFCPVCAQKNSDLQLTFSELIKNFFSNYFALDSRFGRSFKPFFIKPGFLTIEFMKGKRMTYANPIRLYLVFSVIHFFIFSIYFGDDDFESDNGQQELMSDSSYKDQSSQKIILLKDDSIKLSPGTDSVDVFDIQKNLNIIKGMSLLFSMTEIYDSLHLENKSYLTQLTWRQVIKLTKNGESSFSRFFLKNIPILMFFLLPIYAFILKLFFSNKLYINHIVHSLHLHSFFFVILSVHWIISIIFGHSFWSEITTFILLCIYLTLSFSNAYNVKLSTSFFKLLGTGVAYILILFFALLVTFTLSFYTF